MKSITNFSRLLIRLLGVCAALVVIAIIWHLVTSVFGIISPARFPPPAEVGSAFMQIATEGYANASLLEHAARSVMLVTMGFIVASTLGIALGLAMGASRTVEAIANPVFLILRPIPPLAWIPLAIVWLGLGKNYGYFFCRFCTLSHQQLCGRAANRKTHL
jgi:taurine transport system permease protein